MARQKSKFPKHNRVKSQQKKCMKKALEEGYTYGKGQRSYHLPKGELHKLSQPSRYTTDNSDRGWLKKA